MKTYDIVIIGSGSGLHILDQAIADGKTVALIDKGPLGGTCLNVGCIPSKILLYPATRIREINESAKLGITAKITAIDSKKILSEMREIISKAKKKIKQSLKEHSADIYYGTGKFIDSHTLQVNNKQIKGKKIFIATGTKPFIPSIQGLEKVPYYTSDTIFEIKKVPKSIIIVGGGYIGMEFCHFFSAMGTKVTVLQRSEIIIPTEDEEISRLLYEKMKTSATIHTKAHVLETKHKGNTVEVTVKQGRKTFKVRAEMLFVATGRISNADTLKVQNANIQLDKKGYVKVNQYLQTTQQHIYCIGDANGKAPFKHAANYQARIAYFNSKSKKKQIAKHHLVPHAIFTYPEAAAIGLTEQEARQQYKSVEIIKNSYSICAKGVAMKEKKGFAKAIYHKEKLIGFHIIGPEASILIQEVINKIAKKDAMVIHPSLSELIQKTLK